MGPCQFGIGSRFMSLEFPFFRCNLFFWVYVLSFYPHARTASEFREALTSLEAKLGDGEVVVEAPRRGLSALEFCRKGVPCAPASRRFEQIRAHLAA